MWKLIFFILFTSKRIATNVLDCEDNCPSQLNRTYPKLNCFCSEDCNLFGDCCENYSKPFQDIEVGGSLFIAVNPYFMAQAGN